MLMITQHSEIKSMGWKAGPSQGVSGSRRGFCRTECWEIIRPLLFSMNLVRKTIVSHFPNMSYDVSPWEVQSENFPQKLQND